MKYQLVVEGSEYFITRVTKTESQYLSTSYANLQELLNTVTEYSKYNIRSDWVLDKTASNNIIILEAKTLKKLVISIKNHSELLI